MTSPTTAWTDLGQGVLVRQSVAFEMNSTLLLDAEHAVVVDPGVLPSELNELAGRVAAAGPRQVTLILTHAHWDHVLGRPWWPGARTLAHDRFAAALADRREAMLAEAIALAERHGERWTRGLEAFRPDEEVSGIRFMKLGPWKLVLRDAAGHCDHQISVHLPERRLLIAADMLSDIEIPELGQPPAVYRATLRALEPLAAGGAIEELIPDHGSIARGQAKVLERLQRDLAYLDALEAEARAAARAGLAPEAARERLAAMDYPGRGMRGRDTGPQHRINVDHAWAAAAAPPQGVGRGSRSP